MTKLFEVNKGCEMKGRNGYTRLNHITISSITTSTKQEIRIDFASPRSGVIGAAAIILDRESLQILSNQIQSALAEL
jgi:hypothetical protein